MKWHRQFRQYALIKHENLGVQPSRLRNVVGLRKRPSVVGFTAPIYVLKTVGPLLYKLAERRTLKTKKARFYPLLWHQFHRQDTCSSRMQLTVVGQKSRIFVRKRTVSVSVKRWAVQTIARFRTKKYGFSRHIPAVIVGQRNIFRKAVKIELACMNRLAALFKLT